MRWTRCFNEAVFFDGVGFVRESGRYLQAREDVSGGATVIKQQNSGAFNHAGSLGSMGRSISPMEPEFSEMPFSSAAQLPRGNGRKRRASPGCAQPRWNPRIPGHSQRCDQRPAAAKE